MTDNGDNSIAADAAGVDEAGNSEVIELADSAEIVDDGAAEADPLVELTADLQRLQADFTNYRRRAERDRQGAIEFGKSALVIEMLPVLDDLDRARAHGDLAEGPLRGIADKLTEILTGQGLESFGAEGDEFNPELHEAVQNEASSATMIIGSVYRQGYRIGERIVRTAMVVVIDAPTA